MKKPIFTGSNVAIITPFNESGVNYEEFKRIIDDQISRGTDSITICGTTGEGATMTDKEHKEAIQFCIDYVNGRVPVIAGTGSNDTQYALQLSKFASEAGADALLTVTPYYNKTTQQGLIKHFYTLAEATTTPVIVYNVPSRTGLTIQAQTYYELSKHPNINGAKEASGNFSLLAEAMNLCGDDLNFWSGNDDMIVPIMAMGGKGVISVLANVAPEIAHTIAQNCLDGKFAQARELQIKYLDLINALFLEVNPIPVKMAMRFLGWDVGELRMPLCDMTDAHTAQLRDAMTAAGLKLVK
ncbi:MAG TPA: 4-hydroxy-tetrahydrodipicolinate synthase [Clostridiales bacterium]|nr:4-hydroxy-tetrahydrodipicolinate synthase [Clostridiales bacterium]